MGPWGHGLQTLQTLQTLLLASLLRGTSNIRPNSSFEKTIKLNPPGGFSFIYTPTNSSLEKAFRKIYRFRGAAPEFRGRGRSPF